MTKAKPKKWIKGNKWVAKKPKRVKPAYRKPSVASIEAKRTNKDLEMELALLRLAMNVVRSQQAAIFMALDASQRKKVLAYEEE